MSSTEQKNVSQPFISSCFSFGILPTIVSGAFDNYGLRTDMAPFEDLGSTPNLGQRLRYSDDPVVSAQRIFPNLVSAPLSSRYANYLLRLVVDSNVYSGNQAVLRLCDAIITRKWGLRVHDQSALRHACRHVSSISGLLAPASYSMSDRTEGNIRRISADPEFHYLRAASDSIDHLARIFHYGRHNASIRQWCNRNRLGISFGGRYTKPSKAYADYYSCDPEAISSLPEPPALQQRCLYVDKRSSHTLAVYHFGSTYYFKFKPKYAISSVRSFNTPPRFSSAKAHAIFQPIRKTHVASSELLVLSTRDMQDLAFLLHACASVKIYMRRRLNDIRREENDGSMLKIQKLLWKHYMDTMRCCSNSFHLRNKLGVYFDVLQWRYLAGKSGDLFYNHSHIMKQKVQTKDLTKLPSQDLILNSLNSVPVDWAVDLLGIYKASIYPEVDPFKVVGEQYELHQSRHNTDWEPGSDEQIRFEDTRSYMWFLGARVLYNRDGVWPGKIREGVTPKPWHATYKTRGIKGPNWRDATDIDLTNAVITADITDEQYLKQADSASAPPRPHEYSSAEIMRKAPKRHKRKLLYAIQEPELPSLPQALAKLNAVGSKLSEGYVDKIEVDLEFSTDIVTGSRCERHKDAPRPFYAASAPWGCLLSYFDGLTRDFLNNVPQSMLGKSTRQKFTDLKIMSREDTLQPFVFYMSDDKAKYSPRMDPKSQQLPADFFAEVFGIPAFKAFGPIMYHCELYYRVHGHLVHYNSNGTDREGMRGASNTWLEIVAQGLSTRICRDKSLVYGKSLFLSFIDDGLRRFTIESIGKSAEQSLKDARLVIDDVIFGLKVLGREMSWDKTFISQTMYVMLNELVIDGAFISSGLKSFCTIGDLDMKEVMTAADYEQLYFGKMRGAHGVGAPIDLCHYMYLLETLASHFRMGLRLQDKREINSIDYRLFCITPIALGGGGLRTIVQMACNETANATKEGIGTLIRTMHDNPVLQNCISSILTQEVEEISPVDFMREPDQFHVTGHRIKTQRMAAAVRSKLRELVGNDLSRNFLEQDSVGLQFLSEMGKLMQQTPSVGAEEIRLIYASTPVAFIDEFVQKLASSSTLAEFLDSRTLKRLRAMSRKDLVMAVGLFPNRCNSRDLIDMAASDPEILTALGTLNR